MIVIYYLYMCNIFVFLMIRRPPRSTRTDTLLPYTTLFRSQAGVRRFRRLQGKLPARHHRNWLHGPCAPQVLRSARDEQKPTGRTGAALNWQLVRNRTASAGNERRRSQANTRTEERRDGKEWVSKGRSRWSPSHSKKQK